MILDSSAVIAVLFRERNFERLEQSMAGAGVLAMGAPTLLETGMVAVGKFGLPGRGLVSQFLEDWDVEVVSFDHQHCRVGAEAFTRYGKGRHPAGLNYGDCMTYATSRLAEMPLLFVGDDFRKTDIIPALA